MPGVEGALPDGSRQTPASPETGVRAGRSRSPARADSCLLASEPQPRGHQAVRNQAGGGQRPVAPPSPRSWEMSFNCSWSFYVKK